MFKLAISPTFWATVEVEFAAEKGGTAVAKFDVQYRRLSSPEMEALSERIRAERMDDRSIAREVMLGWRGLVGEDDEALPFNEETREGVLNAGFAGAICVTFFNGAPRARAKN
jgi:hypothetical protein